MMFLYKGQQHAIGIRCLIVVPFQVRDGVGSGRLDVKGMSLYFLRNLGEKMCVGIPLLCQQRSCADHGTVGMTGIEPVVVTVSDMITDGVDDRIMVAGIQSRTDNEIFFRCLLQTDSLIISADLRQFA